jgi:predicted aspartyl protease
MGLVSCVKGTVLLTHNNLQKAKVMVIMIAEDLAAAKGVMKLFFKLKILISLVILQLVFSFTGLNVRCEAIQQDELWFRAVQSINQNAYFIPGKVHIVTRERYPIGKWKISGESRVDIVGSADGASKTEAVKDQTNTEQLKRDNGKKNRAIKYNIEYSDLTLLFDKKVQTNLTLERKRRLEIRDGRQCAVYCFRYLHPQGGTISGKVWLSKDGLPVVMNYKTKPLPKEIPPQYHSLTLEVHYHQGDSCYPAKVLVRMKPRIQSIFSYPAVRMEFSFYDYHQPEYLQVQSGGKPVNHLQHPCTVPFEYINGTLYAKVKLNDNPVDYRFIVDTGATTTVINRRIVSGLGVSKVAEVDVSDGYLSQKADLVVFNKVALGEVTVENNGAMVFDFENLEKSGIKVDGILGSNFLRLFTVRIDYTGRTLTFFENAGPFKEETGRSQPVRLIQGPTGLILAVFKVDGAKALFQAEIDTGCSSGLNVPMTFMEDMKPGLNSAVITSKGYVVKGAFGGSVGRLSRIGEFTLGDLSYQNQIVSFTDNNLNILLGNAFLSKFTVIIDYPGNLLYLLPLKDQTFETNKISFGCFLEWDAPEKIGVAGIWEGSAADRGGLRVGDHILRATAGDQSASSLDEIEALLANHDTIHLFVQRDSGVKELVLKSGPLLPEVE